MRIFLLVMYPATLIFIEEATFIIMCDQGKGL